MRVARRRAARGHERAAERLRAGHAHPRSSAGSRGSARSTGTSSSNRSATRGRRARRGRTRDRHAVGVDERAPVGRSGSATIGTPAFSPPGALVDCWPHDAPRVARGRPRRGRHGPDVRQPARRSGDPVLLRPGLHARRARLRAGRRRARGGRARRAAAARARRARGPGRRRARGDGASRPRASTAIRPRRCAWPGITGHQRQDDDGVPHARAARGRGHARAGCSARSSRSSAATSARSCARRPRRSTSSARSARCSTRATPRARWRSPRTRWSCSAPTAIHVAAAVFTNLTQDHLDFHPTMEDYFQAKRLLFASPLTAVRIANADDAYGRRLIEEFADADVRDRARGRLPRASTCARTARAATSWRSRRTGRSRRACRCPGRFNVLNALARVGRGAGAGRAGRRPCRVAGGRRDGARAASSRSRRASRSAWSSTTRTSRTRWSRCCWPRASWRPGG